MGKLPEAQELALNAAKAVSTKPRKLPVFAPRILYAACVVEAHEGRFRDAQAFCRRGLEIANLTKIETRDLSLGYLALAEVYLQAGDLTRSRESALKSVALTVKLFGWKHQDMLDALEVLTQVSQGEGKATEACVRARDSATVAKALFSESVASALSNPRWGRSSHEPTGCQPPSLPAWR